MDKSLRRGSKQLFMTLIDKTAATEVVIKEHLSGHLKSGHFVIDEVDTDSGYFFRLTHNELKVYSMSLPGVVQKSQTLSALEKTHVLEMLDMIPKTMGGFIPRPGTYYNHTAPGRM